MRSEQDGRSLGHYPSAREAVENLIPYIAPLEGRRDFLRLDFNENTIGPSPLVVEALGKILGNQISIYPEYEGLREAFIDNLSENSVLENLFNPSQIGLFNGVDAAIHAIFHAYGDYEDILLTTTPTFGYYAPCAYMQGMKVFSIPYEGIKYTFPYSSIYTYLLKNRPKLFFLCNPNNPTGTRVEPRMILQLAKASPETLIVIDELYEAFTGDSILPIINFSSYKNILVLRSLAKTAGLAGLRIGFAIGHSEIIDRLNRVTGPYDINSFAVTAAFAALKDQQYINSYVAEVLKARNCIRTKLLENKVRHHIDGGNYFLLWPKRNPSEVVAKLKEERILVRDMSMKPFIEGSLRISIGTQSQMSKFWKAFLSIEK